MPDRSFLNWPFFEKEHTALAASLFEWAAKECQIEHADEYALSRKLVRKLGQAGWLKTSVPAPHGGLKPKLDVRSLCLSRETLGYFSSLADFAFAMQGLGSGPLSLFGEEKLKSKYLPEVAAGKMIAAFALSEKGAGSDVAALALSARSEGSEYILDGEKTWISNAGIADFYIVFARTGEAPGAKGLSAILVEASAQGCSLPEKIAITSPHPLGTVRFERCRVPKSNLIGKPGEGFKVAMATLDVFRSTVGAAALGFARRALDEALAWSKERKLFGQPLSQFQMTQGKIADMATAIDASALLVYRAAWTKDQGAERVTREAAMAKLYATESAQTVIDQAVQLLGGAGVVSGSVVERLYRDIRPLRIYEGTSEIQKLIIAREVLQ